MTIVTRRSATTAADVLGRRRASWLRRSPRRAAEIEAARRLPADLLDELKRGRRVPADCAPRATAESAPTFPRALRIFEALARADASVGWTVMIGGAAWLDLAGLPRATFDALFAAGPDVIIAGAFNPTGSIERVDGGYRVTGRWAFASGCEHADWLYGNCVEGDRRRRAAAAHRGASRPTRS